MTTDMASKLSMQSTYKMLSGCEMPVLGFGVSDAMFRRWSIILVGLMPLVDL